MVKGQAWALGRTRVRLSNKPQELSAGGKRASNTQAALAEMWWAKRHNAYTGGGWDAPFFLNFSFPTPQQSFRKRTLRCGMASAFLTFVVSVALERGALRTQYANN